MAFYLPRIALEILEDFQQINIIHTSPKHAGPFSRVPHPFLANVRKHNTNYKTFPLYNPTALIYHSALYKRHQIKMKLNRFQHKKQPKSIFMQTQKVIMKELQSVKVYISRRRCSIFCTLTVIIAYHHRYLSIHEWKTYQRPLNLQHVKR